MKNIYVVILILTMSVIYSCKNQKSEKTNLELKEFVEKEIDYSESVQGAWTSTSKNKNGEEITHTAIVVDGYLAEALYNKESKKFVRTFGGSWTVKENVFYLKEEFSSTDSTVIGSIRESTFKMKGDTIIFEGEDKIWTRIDNSYTDLKGPWLITGRKRDGEMSNWIPGTRKTMKILSGSRFQWIAFDTKNGSFKGTGGGTYTAKNGEYIEHIEFFSRDSSRVGAFLSFEYSVEDGEWNHSGLSSKGNPIYEIWTPRSILDQTTPK